MALNTFTATLRCLEICQETITLTSGIPTQAINETVSNINYIRSTIESVLDNKTDLFNAIKNAASSFSIIAGLGEQIKASLSSNYGYVEGNDYIVNEKVEDRYAPFMTISTLIAGGEIGNYTGLARGNIVKLDGITIPNVLGRSLIKNILKSLENFSVQNLGYATYEQANNVVLIIETFQFLMLINLCRIAIRTEFSSQDELFEYKDLIKDGFDLYLNNLSLTASGGAVAIGIGLNDTQINNTVLFDGADKMREVIINQLLLKSEKLSKSINYMVKPDVENTLILAYNKYEDINRSSEIYLRNKEQIKNPAFLPSGDEIRILSD